MPHLVEEYSRTTGLRIDKMLLTEHFYPLGIDKPYIVVVTSSGAEGKNYSYYQIVIDALRVMLKELGFAIVQAGGKDDIRIGADVDTCGQTSGAHFNYIISGAALVLSGDTSALHIAGHYDKKLVSLFSISHPKISGAYFGSKSNQIYLTPSTEWSPSFNPNEYPKQINQIKPESVVAAVGKLLGIKVPKFNTLYIGDAFDAVLLESVPNTIVRPDFMPHSPLNIRFDKGGNEETVYQQLRVRKCVVVADKPLDTNILHQLRPNIDGLVYLVGENDSPKFVEDLHRNAFPYKLMSLLSEEEVRDKKLNYIDFNLLERKDHLTKKSIKPDGEVGSQTFFRTKKKILSNGKAYLSYAHLSQEKPLDNFTQNEDNVIDIPDFWQDADFYHIFNK